MNKVLEKKYYLKDKFVQGVQREKQTYNQLYIKDKNGNLIGEEEKAKERWKEYFCEISDGGMEKEVRGEEKDIVVELPKDKLEKVVNKCSEKNCNYIKLMSVYKFPEKNLLHRI